MYREQQDRTTTKLTGGPTLKEILLAAYPVGAIYMSAVVTSPATLFGGTWVATGVGRVLVGYQGLDPDFGTVLQTGGAKTHTLTEAEMPAHVHNSGDYATSTDGQHAHDSERSNATGSGANFARGTNADDVINPFPILQAGNHSHDVTGSSGSTGGGGAHNNLQPYQVVYMWRRTA
jgi:microcystin-dependent protein